MQPNIIYLLTVDPLAKSQGKGTIHSVMSKYERNWVSTAGALTHSLVGDKETVAGSSGCSRSETFALISIEARRVLVNFNR